MNEVIVPVVGAQTVTTVHQTAVQMQSHFAHTGSYKPQDIQKVLGDITASVTVVTEAVSAVPQNRP